MFSLYYHENKESIIYKNSPDGGAQLNISRLISNESQCWQINKDSQVKKPCNLIFYDWTGKYWTPFKFRQFRERLYDLLDKGFSAYVWKKGELIPLLKSSKLNALLFSDATDPEQDSRCHKAAAEMGMSKDSLAYIKSCEVNAMLDFPDLYENIPLSKKIYINQQTLRLPWQPEHHPSFCLRQLSHSTIEYWNVIKTDEMSVDIRSISICEELSYNEFNDYLQHCSCLEELELKCSFDMNAAVYHRLNEWFNEDPRRIKSLRSLSIKYEINRQENITLLDSLFRQNTALKYLSVRGDLSVLETCLIPHNKLSNLNILYFKDSYNDATLFKYILHTAKQLNSFYKAGKDKGAKNNLLEALSLATLEQPLPRFEAMENIVIKNDDIPSLEATRFLECLPNLRSFEFCSHILANIERDKPPMKEGSLSNIENLYFPDAPWLSEKVLSETKQLTSIYCLEDIEQGTLERILEKNPAAFATVEEIELDNLIELKCLLKLLNHSPKLCRLSLFEISEDHQLSSQDPSSLIHKPLVSLKSITLNNWNYDLHFLAALLCKTTQLKELMFDVDNDIAIDDEEQFKFFHLMQPAWPYLEQLLLDDAFMTENAINILSQCQNLRELHLSSRKDLEKILTAEFLERHQSMFRHLNSLDLSESNADAKLIKSISEYLPDLNRINLFKCKQFSINEYTEAYCGDITAIYNYGEETADDTLTIIDDGSDYPRKCLSFDADTSPDDDDEDYYYPRIFYGHEGNHPDTLLIRESIFDKLLIKNNCNQNSPFEIHQTEDPEFVPYTETIKQASYRALYFSWETMGHDSSLGSLTMEINYQWQALPSLTANDQLLQLFVEGFRPDEIEINYSHRDSQYYIRAPDVETRYQARVSFIIDTPAPDMIAEQIEDSELEDIIERISGFKAEPLDLPDKALSGDEYLHAINEQEKGACRHRAVLFMSLILQNERLKNKYPIRLVANKSHVFAEIKYNGRWLTCDLGGYPAGEQLNEYLNPEKMLEEEKREMKFSTLNPLFKTWTSSAYHFNDLKEYTNHLLDQYAGKNLLVDFQCKEHLENYTAYLHLHLKTNNIPHFYIDHPEQIVCISRWIERQDDNSGRIHQGLGGRLYNFLKQHERTLLVIIINWSNFSPEEIASCNSIIDIDKRIADTVTLPEQATVLGLHDICGPNAYRGADFYGRFANQDKAFPKALESLLYSPLGGVERISEENALDDGDIVIDLYNDPSWQPILLGQWSLKNDRLIFVPGQLEMALEQYEENSYQRIILKNPPLSCPSFQTFYSTQLDLGCVHLYGKHLEIPEELDFAFQEEMSLAPLATALLTDENTPSSSSSSSSSRQDYQPAEILNPSSLGSFYNRYRLNNGKFNSRKGLIESYKGKTLSLVLSREIKPAHWYKLLTECKKNQVTVKITAPATLSLPEDIRATRAELMLSDKIKLICTDDIDYSLANLAISHEKIIDISEMDGTNLLDILMTKKDNGYYQLELHASSLWQALEAGETVILKGQCHPELIDKLSEIFLFGTYTTPFGERRPVKGQILLLTDNSKGFEFAGQQNHRQAICLEQKMERLDAEPSIKQRLKTHLEEQKKDNESFARLQAMARHLAENPAQAPEQRWKAYHQLETTSFSVTELDENIVRYFEQERLGLIQNNLQQEPFVFIAGVTGVGKSTFIKEVLAKQKGVKVYFDMAHIINWATDDSQQMKVLFIDEANIEMTDFSLFEGLYSPNPGILIKGQFYPLSKNHKLVFAGNPLNYGGERKLARFFERHGNAITFHPLPPAYLFHKILKPILGNAVEACNILLNVYLSVLALMPETVLLTPRELGMMAMQIISWDSQRSPRTALYFAYTMAKQTVPEHLQAALDNEFIKQYQSIPKHPEIIHYPAKLNRFVMTACRQEPFRMLFDFLMVRKYQQTNINPIFNASGINALLIEGQPGDGKSQFVQSFLKAHEFEEVFPNQIDSMSHKAYCYIPVGMPTKKKQKYLIQAFHAGLIVIIEEMNSSLSLEKVYNSLLMGVDLKGQQAKKPGFKLIGTGNPIDFAGRKAMSLALKRRCIHCRFVSYPKDELLTILNKQSFAPPEDIEALVDDFLLAKDYAEREQLQPKPSFRTLLTATQALRRKRTHANDSEKSSAKKAKQRQASLKENKVNFFSKQPVETERSASSSSSYTPVM